LNSCQVVANSISSFWHNPIQIEVEKRKLQQIFNWTGIPGTSKPSVVWYKTGIVAAGPSGEVKVSNSIFFYIYKVLIPITGQYFWISDLNVIVCSSISSSYISEDRH
jgi:hypothetical protein